MQAGAERDRGLQRGVALFQGEEETRFSWPLRHLAVRIRIRIVARGTADGHWFRTIDCDGLASGRRMCGSTCLALLLYAVDFWLQNQGSWAASESRDGCAERDGRVVVGASGVRTRTLQPGGMWGVGHWRKACGGVQPARTSSSGHPSSMRVCSCRQCGSALANPANPNARVAPGLGLVQLEYPCRKGKIACGNI